MLFHYFGITLYQVNTHVLSIMTLYQLRILMINLIPIYNSIQMMFMFWFQQFHSFIWRNNIVKFKWFYSLKSEKSINSNNYSLIFTQTALDQTLQKDTFGVFTGYLGGLIWRWLICDIIANTNIKVFYFFKDTLWQLIYQLGLNLTTWDRSSNGRYSFYQITSSFFP